MESSMTKEQLEFKNLVQQVEAIFMEKIPFNRLLGMHILEMNHECTKIKIDMREELVGNYIQGILHGGVISAMLDVTGGVTAFVDLLKKMGDATAEEKLERLSKFGTIDLRIDFLRPGRGKYFISEGTVLRTGNKVAVTRMELHNDKNTLIAVGTGTYLAV